MRVSSGLLPFLPFFSGIQVYADEQDFSR
ncbi:hypothetical protein EMIT0P74_70046 [Pseudomonas sp. IT-P74]